MPSDDDFLIDQVGILQDGLAEIAQMSPDATFDNFATARAFNEAILEDSVLAE